MQKFHEKINNPKVLFAMLNVTNASRGSIKKLSKMKIPEYIEHDDLDLKAIRKQSENDEDKYEIDPALATGPFITTANDIFGIFLFFYVAKIVLSF